jgi:thiol-disulfide isomerase/thioredoxin
MSDYLDLGQDPTLPLLSEEDAEPPKAEEGSRYGYRVSTVLRIELFYSTVEMAWILSRFPIKKSGANLHNNNDTSSFLFCNVQSNFLFFPNLLLQTARLVGIVWALCAIIVLGLISATWDNLAENGNDVWEDIKTQVRTPSNGDGYHEETHVIQDKGASDTPSNGDGYHEETYVIQDKGASDTPSNGDGYHEETHVIQDKEDYPWNSHSIELTEANWDEFQRDHPMAFVNFYVPWAIWCQRMAPTWEDFANEVERREMSVAVGRVDCIKNSKLCESEKVDAFPTLRFYHNGDAIVSDYKMVRTVGAFMGYVNSKMGFPGAYEEHGEK